MSDEVTEVTTTSWLQRIGQAFGGIIFGILLIIGTCILLFWNEGRAVQTARSLTEGAGLVQAVAADKVDAANEGKLIYITGPLTTSGPATDGEFGMKSTGVRLIRDAQMYQWKEEVHSDTKKNTGGSETTTKTYKYSKEWSGMPVDSSKFHDVSGHANPQMAWRQREALASKIKLGAFSVPDSLMENFGTQKPLAAGDDQVQVAKKRTDKPVQVVDGVIYIGNPSEPAVGDFKISFREVTQQTASVVARQAESSLGPYRTRAGGNVELISAGTVPATELFKEAQDENRLWTWLIRGGGTVLMLIGFALIFRPLSVLADVLPILGDIVGFGTGLIAMLCTAVLAPLVIAIAWFVYRPLVSVAVLVVGGALAFGVIRLMRQRKANKVAAPAAAT